MLWILNVVLGPRLVWGGVGLGPSSKKELLKIVGTSFCLLTFYWLILFSL
jgi:hypothetical protein